MKRINIKHNYFYPISSSLVRKWRSSLLLKMTVRSSRLYMFFKIVVLKSFCNMYTKTPLPEQLYEKETSTQVFFFEIFKKSLFYRAFLVAGGCFSTFRLFSKLLFLTFSISPFRSGHRKCSIKKIVLKILR